LLYGLLQQGRHNEASQLLEAAYKEALDAGAVPKNPLALDADRSQVGSLVQMWGRYMIETRGKDRDKATWNFSMGEAFDPKLTYHYVLALDAAYFEKPTVAKEHLKTFQTLKTQLQSAILAMERQAPTDLVYLDRLGVLDLEIQAAITSAEEDTDKALEFAREASRLEGEMPFAFGPPFIDLPSAELLGEILLNAGYFDEAVEAFETQGERTRLKSLPMLGLARAEEARGNHTAATHIREMLGPIWIKADADIKAKLISK
jgi:tetratricopeptide (TPR) repeat protein